MDNKTRRMLAVNEVTARIREAAKVLEVLGDEGVVGLDVTTDDLFRVMDMIQSEVDELKTETK